jgi:hypothetical protein
MPQRMHFNAKTSKLKLGFQINTELVLKVTQGEGGGLN